MSVLAMAQICYEIALFYKIVTLKVLENQTEAFPYDAQLHLIILLKMVDLLGKTLTQA